MCVCVIKRWGVGGPGLTVCQQTQLEQKEGSPLKAPQTPQKKRE